MLDTLYQEVLAEYIQDNQRCNDHQTASVSDCRVVKLRTRELGVQGRRNTNKLRQHVNIRAGEEHIDVEFVSPLPAECKQEYGDHHGDGQRKNDLDEGAERARTVHVCGFFQFVRNSTEELTEQEDVQTVLECQTAQREQDHGKIGVVQVNARCGNFHVNLILGNVLGSGEFTPLNGVRQYVQVLKELNELCTKLAANLLTQLHNIVSKQLNSAALEELNDTKDIKVTELKERCRVW